VDENEVRLSGEVIGREALRHSPAGIPILAFALKHHSTQNEAGTPRQLDFEMDAMAVGETAQRMNAMQAGQKMRLRGFLASRSRLSTRIVLHVTQFEFE